MLRRGVEWCVLESWLAPILIIDQDVTTYQLVTSNHSEARMKGIAEDDFL